MRSAAAPHEVLLVADSLTGQDAVNLARAFNERLDITGIVLTRVDGDGRGGAALSMRAVTGKPIKLIGTGEKLDAIEDFYPAAYRRPHSRHGRYHLAGRKGGDHHRCREGGARRREDAQGRLRPVRSARATDADEESRRHVRLDGDDARHRENQKSIGRTQSRRDRDQAADGDHRFHDAGERRNPGHPQGQPQAPHRRRLRHQAGRHQQASENAPHHGRHDEGDGRRQARPDGGPRQYAGLRRRHAVRGTDGRSWPKNCRAGCRRIAGRSGQRFGPAARHAGSTAEYFRDCQKACRRIFRGFPVSVRNFRGGLPGLGKKK